MRTLSFTLLLSILCAALLAPGCQVYNAATAFIGQRYTNTVSYFNTYYNAQRAFDDAEKELLASQKNQPARTAGSTPGSQVPQSARGKFNTAIEKASKLLSYYPTCKWVDDALLLIGKSYFYLEDDLKAERKFLELFAKYPDSDLRYEAELWYGRSLLRQKRYAEGEELLDKLYGKGVDHGEKEIAALASLALAKHYYEKEEFEKATKYYQLSLAVSSDEVLNADTQLQLGYCYRAMKDLKKASETFSKVEDHSPEYATSFTAKLENVKILVEQRDYKEALDRLNRFLLNAKNSENFSKIHYEIGEIYLAQNRIDDAVVKFTYLDTAYARTDEAARGYYELGTIYETMQNDYGRARSNYDKAKLEYPSSSVTPIATRKADAFAKYFALRTDLAKYDSLLANIERRKVRRDSLAAVPDTTERSDTLSSATPAKSKIRLSAKELQKKVEANRDSLARLDSVRSALENRVAFTDQHNADSLRFLIVKAHFELAGIFYLEINQADSALYWFQKVVGESPGGDLAPRALYTSAEIYRTSKEKGKSFLDSLYGAIIVRYPESPYAQESRRVLGMQLLAAKKDSADELYSRAEMYMDGARADSALELLYRIVRENAASPFSPKALYAIGWLYENKINNRDSASAVYRRLVAGYPESKFALAVRPKIQEEDNARKEAEQKAKEELEAQKKKEAEQKKTEKEPDDSKTKVIPNKEKP